MNCELAHERIVLAAYGELPDDATHELERHLATCQECGQEREQLRALKLLAEAHPVEEVPANLVARSRIRLEEALDALPPKRWFERLLDTLRNNAASLQTAPIAAALLLLVGAGAGSLGGYHIAQSKAARADAALQSTRPPDTDQGAGAQNASAVTGADSRKLDSAGVVNVSSIVREPNSQQVEVHYDQLVPHAVRGSLDDPAIR